MKSFLLAPVLLALVSAVAVQRRVNYDGAQVMRLSIGEDVSKVEALISSLSLSTWKGKVTQGGQVDLVVPAGKTTAFAEGTVGLAKEVMHEDLGASIREESAFDIHRAGTADQSWFNSYHPFNDHLQFLTDIQTTFPNNAEVVNLGSSTQGRPINGIHIFGSGGKGSKPAVVLHGTVHAREWISAMVNEYLAYNLLSNYANDTDVASIVDNHDFYFLPVINPDGFVYSQTTDRLWRKNRQAIAGSTCIGNDMNRNWDAFWNVPGGASTSPCADTFKGKAPADAVETKIQQDFLQQLSASAPGLKMFMDIHSYSQLFMTPYGYSCQEVSANNVQHQALADAFANALRAVYGTRYTTGPICTTIYQTSGNSADYAFAKANATYSFAAELRDTGRNGFVLPPAQIRPSGVETFAGFKALMKLSQTI